MIRRTLPAAPDARSPGSLPTPAVHASPTGTSAPTPRPDRLPTGPEAVPGKTGADPMTPADGMACSVAVPSAVSGAGTPAAPSPRETWILENLAPRLAARIAERDGRPLTPLQAFRLFRDADPSPRGSGLQWAIQAYLRDAFPLSEVEGGSTSAMAEALRLFERHKGRLPAERRSLPRHASPAALREAAAPFAQEEERTGRGRRRGEREQAYGESVVLHESPLCTVAVPLTEAAACWWGKGTRWCTAARDRNMFANYAGAPLVVFSMADGERIQLHASRHAVHVRNASNEGMPERDVEERWHVLGGAFLWAAAVASRDALGFVPEHLRTERLCLAAVARDGTAFHHVPRALRSDRMTRIAARSGGLCWVPAEYRTWEACVSSAEWGPHQLPDVPRHLLGAEIRRIAIGHHGTALQHLPSRDRTPEMCALALRSDPLALRHVPASLRTGAMIRDAVERNGQALRDLPHALWSEELIVLAVRTDPHFLSCVPPAMLGEAVCRAAVERHPRARGWVPHHLLERMPPSPPATPAAPAWDIGMLDTLRAFLEAGPTDPPLHLLPPVVEPAPSSLSTRLRSGIRRMMDAAFR